MWTRPCEPGRPAGRGRLAVCLLVLAAVCAVARPAPGDELVLKSGQSFTGRLVRRDGKRVVFEIHADGMLLKRSYQAEQVAEVRRARLYAGTYYYVVPIRGTIGSDVTAPVLKKCLDLAASNLTGVVPDVVILDIDSPGGDAAELLRLVDTLAGSERLRIAAYVRSAASAAAVLAMSRREIIVAPDGSIGGAVLYRITPDGTPANIEEKMQSIWRARFRAVVSRAGHEPLLMEGIMRTDIALGLVHSGGGVRVVPDDRGQPLKPKGTILTLSAEEAVRTRLALGVSKDIRGCHRLLGLPAWKELLPGTAAGIFEAWRNRLQDARKWHAAASQEAVALYDKAMAGHPNRSRYKVDAKTRAFLPESKAQWQQRSAACGLWLRQAEEKLDQAEEIAEDFPQLRLSTAKVAEFRSRCVRLRKAVEAEADRTGLPAAPASK